jgi:hypothetical protein
MNIGTSCRCAAICLAASFPIAAQTSSVLVPAGDATISASPKGAPAPGWLDIVAADFTIEPDGSFTFSVTLAEPVPAVLPRPPGEDATFVWVFPLEYGASIQWDGTGWFGKLGNRIGGSPLPLPFTVSGDTLTVSVPATLTAGIVVSPGARWRALTLISHTSVDSNGAQFTDVTPWTPWPEF